MICAACKQPRLSEEFERGQERCMYCQAAAARKRYANNPRLGAEISAMWDRAILAARKRAKKRSAP